MLQRVQQAWKLFHLPTIHRHLLMSEERHRQAWKFRSLIFRSFHHPVLHRRSHLMAQFEQIKKQYAGYVLLFQVGDFYELYGDDASTWLVSGNCRHNVPLMLIMCILFPLCKIFLRSSTHSNCIHCSSVLCHSLPGEVASKTSLRLTRKNNVFMAGFPVRALDEWQRSLVEAGFQLAICNQIKRM